MISSRYSRLLAHPFASLLALRRRFLPSPKIVKSHEAYMVLGSWTFGRAPRRPIREMFPGIEESTVHLRNLYDRTPGTSVDPVELAAICAIAANRRSAKIVEIGTFDGNTALNLAANSPADARVWTVDLPRENQAGLAIDVPHGMRNMTNHRHPVAQYEGTDLAAKITQVYCDSANLDWARFGPPVDLVFIDACHYYQYVRHDTEQALANLSSTGVIIWHDYGISLDVSKAVDEFSDRLTIEAISGQRLAIGRIAHGPSATAQNA